MKALLAAIGVMACVGTAQASVLTHTETVFTASVEDYELDFRPLSVSFAPFATDLGPILAISFDWTGNVFPGLTIYRQPGALDTVTMRPVVGLTAQGLPESLTFGTEMTIPADYADGSLGVQESLQAHFDLPNSDLEAFLASPYVTLDVATQLTGFTGEGAISSLYDRTAFDGLLTMTVNYDPPDSVPEPASLSLLAIGLAGVAWSTKRKGR